MVVNQRVTGRAWSMPAGIGMGLGAAAGVTVLGCAAVAMLMESETIPVEAMGYGAMGILMAASFLGAVLAAALIRRRRLLVTMIHGVGYAMVLMLVNGLLFGGAVSGFPVTVLVILAGSVCAAMLPAGESGKIRRSDLDMVKLYKNVR